MKVQCILCERPSELEDDSTLAKKLRNRPIHTYLCQSCYDRIKVKTEARLASGSFQLFSYNTQDDDF